MFLFAARRTAVLWNRDPDLAHVCIASGNQDAAIGRESRQNKSLYAEIVEQERERRLIKGGVPRLQHNIVLGAGCDRLDKRPHLSSALQTVPKDLGKTGSPSPEMVVYIDDGDSRFPRPLLEFFKVRHDCGGVFQQLLSAGKIEVIDHIDEQQSHFAGAAVVHDYAIVSRHRFRI